MYEIERYVQLVLFAAMALLTLFSLADALLRSADAFHATGKLSKPAWALILVLALAIDVIVLWPQVVNAGSSPMTILGIASLVAAGVYLADVRPALQEIGRR